MSILFTVEHALNYEGWELNTSRAPYNWYTVDEYNIYVRRNQFYLLVRIWNKCNEQVFYGHIHTIDEYRSKIKKNLKKWKCRKAVTINTPPLPPPPDTLVIIPSSYNVVINANEDVRILVAKYYYEEAVYNTSANPLPSNLDYEVSGGNIYLVGNTSSLGLNIIDNGEFIGDLYGTLATLTANITVVGTPPPSPGSYIIQENLFKIKTEDNSGYLIREN